MFKLKIAFLVSVLVLPLMTLASADSKTIVKGKQFQVIAPSPRASIHLNIPKNKVIVMEFFSYGCPWCFKIDPAVEKWKKEIPNYVIFERVPVVFESGWNTYSKAFYAAKALGLLDTITPSIFNAIHKKGLDLTSEPLMQKLFAQHHIDKKTFNSVFKFSPGIGAELNRANQLMMTYKIFAIPTFVIDGKYKTNIMMTKGSVKKLLTVVNYLAKKEIENNSKTK